MKSKIIKGLLILACFVFLITCIPLIINKMYLKNSGYITVWSGADVLAFYGAILSLLGTVILGGVTLWQNDKLNKINVNINQQQYKPLLIHTFTPFEDIQSQKEKHRTFSRDVEQNSENVMINNGYSSKQDKHPDVILGLSNIGLGLAINIKIFMHKLESVKGIASLDEIEKANISVEDFYDNFEFVNYEYCEKDIKLNDDWQIYTDFSLGISEENNKLNLCFNFKNIKENIYSIIEFRYKNIAETEFTQYMYIRYNKETSTVGIMPISSAFIRVKQK